MAVMTVKERTDQMLASDALKNEDISDGSLFQIVASMYAVETENIDTETNISLKNAFPSTADEENLETNGYNMAVDREQETYATGKVTITAVSGTVIPDGTKALRSEDGFSYTITAGGTINLIPVEFNFVADTLGTDGNCEIGDIDSLSITDGILLVENEEKIDSGKNLEDLEVYRERVVSFERRPRRSGNASHYVSWAEEVDGIVRAKCFPAWDGGGTVKVTAINDDYEPISEDKRQEMEEYLLENVPIDANLTTTIPTVLLVNIVATLVLNNGWDLNTAETDIRTNLDEYIHNEVAFKTTGNNETVNITYLDIASVIYDSDSVKSVTTLTINGGTSTIVVGDEQVPKINNVIISL